MSTQLELTPRRNGQNTCRCPRTPAHREDVYLRIADFFVVGVFLPLILQLYARLIPFELDDAARVDGASAVQVYLRIYLPLMTPALAVVAIYALMLAWNDYLYPAVLLAVRNMTVAVTQGQLFADVDAEWNAMMAAAIIYVLPPIALLFALRRYVAASLTMAEITE